MEILRHIEERASRSLVLPGKVAASRVLDNIPVRSLRRHLPLPDSAGGLIRDSLPAAISHSKSTWIPASAAALAVFIAVTVMGRRDSGSAVAPINASSHVLWGDEAASVEKVTLKHTLPGAAINLGAAFWWAVVFRKLFGQSVDHRGAAAAMAGGVATAGLAYAVDYHLLPRRLTPGWEQRISSRSLAMSLAAMGIGLGLGAVIARRP